MTDFEWKNRHTCSGLMLYQFSLMQSSKHTHLYRTCRRTRIELSLLKSDTVRSYLGWNSINLTIGGNLIAQNNRNNRQIMCTYVHMCIITNKYSWAGIFRRTFESRCLIAATSLSAIDTQWALTKSNAEHDWLTSWTLSISADRTISC